MASLSRRGFLFVSSGAAAGQMLVPGMAAADERRSPWAESGLVTGSPKPLRYAAIPGFLSAEQMAPHHSAHYGGALRAFAGIEARFEEYFGQGTAIDPLAFESMQRLKSSRGNSVLLHELYFDHLALEAAHPPVDVRSAIERRFGSLERWADDFRASAAAAAGWAMLTFHPVNGRLYNVVSDEHAMGPLWMAAPLVVIDVYEHAYYIDYHNRKADYVQKFMDHIDWTEVDARYRRAAG